MNGIYINYYRDLGSSHLGWFISRNFTFIRFTNHRNKSAAEMELHTDILQLQL
jgi:hypothetical protein